MTAPVVAAIRARWSRNGPDDLAEHAFIDIHALLELVDQADEARAELDRLRIRFRVAEAKLLGALAAVQQITDPSDGTR